MSSDKIRRVSLIVATALLKAIDSTQWLATLSDLWDDEIDVESADHFITSWRDLNEFLGHVNRCYPAIRTRLMSLATSDRPSAHEQALRAASGVNDLLRSTVTKCREEGSPAAQIPGGETPEKSWDRGFDQEIARRQTTYNVTAEEIVSYWPELRPVVIGWLQWCEFDEFHLTTLVEQESARLQTESGSAEETGEVNESGKDTRQRQNKAPRLPEPDSELAKFLELLHSHRDDIEAKKASINNLAKQFAADICGPGASEAQIRATESRIKQARVRWLRSLTKD